MAAIGTGTKDDPWVLKTPPGTSEYQMWRDDAADPPTLYCQVGSTQLKYHLRAIDDLHAMLKATATGCHSAGRMSRSPHPRERSRPGVGRRATRSAAGTALKKGLRGRFGVYLPPLLEALGLAELTHDAKNNRMRAR